MANTQQALLRVIVPQQGAQGALPKVSRLRALSSLGQASSRLRLSAADHAAEAHKWPVDVTFAAPVHYIYMATEFGRAPACTLLLVLAAACGGAASEEATDVGEAYEQSSRALSLYSWREVARVGPRPYANPFIVSQWGYAVDVAAGRVAVSAFAPDVDLFRRQADRRGGVDYVREASFRVRRGAPNGQFGWDVATDGTRLAIGAAGGESGGSAGYVDIYVRSGTTWAYEATVEPQGLPPSYVPGQQLAFGRAVDIDGDTLVVGADRYDAARGAAFVYRRVNGTWIHEAFLEPTLSYTDSYFGKDVSVSGDRIVISHAGLGHFSDFAGHVLVYRRDAGAWTLEADLTSGLAGPDAFGSSVSLSGDHLAATTLSDVRVYERFGTAWALVFSAPRAGDTGTRSLAFDGVRVAVRSGDEVLVFRDSTSGFYLEETEADPDPNPGDQYGISVGLAGPTMVLSKPSSKRGWVYERRKLQIYPGPW